MNRLFNIIREATATFGAAVEASAAVRGHQMPSKAALRQLGIAEESMRSVKF